MSADRIKSRYQIYRGQAEKVLEVFPAYLDVQKLALMGQPLDPAARKGVARALRSQVVCTG